VQNESDHWIIDAGANCGIFTLFARMKYPNCKIMSFEPIPPTFHCLELNTQQHLQPNNIHLYQCGLSDRSGNATFTHYPNRPGVSSMYFGDNEMKEKKIVALSALASARSAPDHSQEFFTQCLETKEVYDCKLVTLSEMMEKHQVEKVTLLKIDVEGAEFDVLKGISDADFRKIDNIVVEVENQEVVLPSIVEYLESKGFSSSVHHEISLWFSTIYAVRKN